MKKMKKNISYCFPAKSPCIQTGDNHSGGTVPMAVRYLSNLSFGKDYGCPEPVTRYKNGGTTTVTAWSVSLR